MVTGRSVIIVMSGGYEMVRRAATPKQAVLAQDRGAETATFDRVYRFEDTQYHIRQGLDEEFDQGTVIVSELTDDGEEVATASQERNGTIDDVYIIELERFTPPTIVVVIRTKDEVNSTECLSFHRPDKNWVVSKLEPLAEELNDSYLGNDSFEQQGAFLYRKVDLAQKSVDADPSRTKFFYDFKNQRWVYSD